MKRTRLNPRKLLIASAGVATVNYAFAAGCGGDALVANLVAGPPAVGGSGGSGARILPGGTGGNSSYPAVANLVAPPGPIGSPPPLPPTPRPPDAGQPDAAADAATTDAAAPPDATVDGG